MIELVPFEPWHAKTMRVQEAQALDARTLNHVDKIEGDVICTLLNNAVPLLIGGVAPVWEGRGIAWSIVSRYAAGYMHQVTKLARSHIEGSGFRRVEMMVRSTFTEAHRWARLLGFSAECEMIDFKPAMPEGFRDEYLYVRLL